ncbi:O-methyltransferase, partial [candidate division KSB1 bacterium]|nr:O-methyltransferase [candidate division KSB1 bacterium]
KSRRDRALDYFEKAGVSHKIEFHVGLAQDVLKTFNEPFDIILNDVDKDQYPDVPDIAIPHLRSGGMLITDNALWGTRVVDPNVNDEDTEGVRKYNRIVYDRTDIFTTIIPLRDGVAVSVKY